ncbi:MAG: hypothetical protein K2K38_02285 [Clostridia bacterium]|nr:hypothetical protein [Clostridia bacterium]
MIHKITSEEVLKYLGDYLQLSLNEIKDLPERKGNSFLNGSYYAFVECLEIITIFWDKAHLYDLDFAPEERFPLD